MYSVYVRAFTYECLMQVSMSVRMSLFFCVRCCVQVCGNCIGEVQALAAVHEHVSVNWMMFHLGDGLITLTPH